MTEVRATYRLQLGPGLDFGGAAELVPYLADLGVSHLYLSPIMRARAGSTHGYDVVDPTVVSPELGGEGALRALASAGLPLIVDFVPNHMAAVEENPFWTHERDRVFDIDPVTDRPRRFFDIDDLAGVRVEDPDVFAATHAKILELVLDGVVDGLRIDHIDGLADPAGYLARLRDAGVGHVWVEKILEPGEPLRLWTINGTTGYEFLNDAMALFVDPAAEDTFTDLAGEHRPFHDIAHHAKLEQATTTFAPEVERLERVDAVPGIAEALAALPVYRTYVDPYTGTVDDLDRAFTADLPPAVRARLLLEHDAPPEFVVQFQQTSGAVMAKGVEDTAFYRYVRLLALNEVGGDPGRFGLDVAGFHRGNDARARDWPLALLAAQTHDTKRSLDARSRLVALTWLAERWCAAVNEWRAHNTASRSDDAPDAVEELFLYQTLVATWPISDDRLRDYLVKALREAKRTTNWLTPNEEHEQRVIDFARRITRDAQFLARFEPFVDDVAVLGERISLGQVVLRVTAPGIPDVYQGDELWDLSLVDPDNRRPVDWEHRRALLADLQRGAAPTRATAKLFTVHTLLDLRRRRPDAFAAGYTPLGVDPLTCAYRRGDDVAVTVATRDVAPRPPELDGEWRNVLEPLRRLDARAPAVFERV